MYWTSDPQIGSDMLFRRTRVSAGGDVSIGRHFSLLPQATYGLLRGETPPQEAFYLGGVANVRTLKRNALAGAGRVFGRLDLILVDDLTRALHLPIPARLPLQFGTFAGSGAVWGRDPVTGDAVPTPRTLPHADEFYSEVGAGLLMRIGVPSPLTSLRFELAFPIGADGRGAAYALAVQEPLSLLTGR
jgi:outer membrane protein assembly factor BamA